MGLKNKRKKKKKLGEIRHKREKQRNIDTYIFIVFTERIHIYSTNERKISIVINSELTEGHDTNPR